MNTITLLLVCGSVWGLFQLLAVLIGWRFTAIRPRFDAALQVRDEAITEWESTDRMNRWAQPDDIDALVDAIHEDRDKAHFELWENEIRERAQ